MSEAMGANISKKGKMATLENLLMVCRSCELVKAWRMAAVSHFEMSCGHSFRLPAATSTRVTFMPTG
jgi:hypothetical protein